MVEKEEFAIVLDYLPYGYPMAGGRMNPMAQAIGEKTLAILELIPRKGVSLAQKEKVYIGPEKRDKIYYIAGRLPRDKLTEAAKIQLQEFIEKVVAEQEKKYVDFFNNAQAMNTRLHQLELLPGFGKKHTQELITVREQKPFESFADMKREIAKFARSKEGNRKKIDGRTPGEAAIQLVYKIMATETKTQDKKPEKKAQKAEQPKAKKPEADMHMETLVRIYGYDIPGSKNVYVGLTKIKGISWSLSNALIHQVKITPSTKILSLSKDQIHQIEQALESINVPDFLKNRRSDPETGKTEHLVGTDLDVRKDFDIKRLKKIKSYKGVRHSLKLPVRGQRTRSHFRMKSKNAAGKARKPAAEAKSK